MSYSWGTDLPALDALQMRARATLGRGLLEARELRVVP